MRGCHIGGGGEERRVAHCEVDLCKSQLIKWDEWTGGRGDCVHADARAEVIGFDVPCGVGEALGVELGADEVP